MVATDLFSSLDPIYPSNDLNYGIWEVLPYERLKLAELLLAQNRFNDAAEAAAVFDHPGPTIFLFFLKESLALRAEAAEAMGWDEQAAGLRRRLEILAG
jgi:hypothetical protein